MRVSTMQPLSVDAYEFATDHLTVRAFRRTDFCHWFSARGAMLPKQNQFDALADGRVALGESHFLKLVESYELLARNSVILLGVFARKDGTFLGESIFCNINRNIVQSARFSYGIVNNRWREGFGSELLAGGIRHAFSNLRFHRLEFWVHPENTVSIALIQKFRMTRECVKREALYIDGRWQDHIVYFLTCDQYGVESGKPEIMV